MLDRSEAGGGVGGTGAPDFGPVDFAETLAFTGPIRIEYARIHFWLLGKLHKTECARLL